MDKLETKNRTSTLATTLLVIALDCLGLRPIYPSLLSFLGCQDLHNKKKRRMPTEALPIDKSLIGKVNVIVTI